MRKLIRYLVTGVVVAAAVIVLGYRYLDYLQNPWTRDGQVRATVIQVAPRVSGPITALPIRDNQRVKKGDVLFRIDPRTYKAAHQEAKANLDKTVDDLAALGEQVEAAEASVEQYRSAIKQAESRVRSAAATLKEAKVNLSRNRELLRKGTIAQARLDRVQRNYDVDQAAKDEADAALVSANNALLQSKANLAKARADFGAPGEENALLRAARAEVETAGLDLEFTEMTASVDGLVTNLKLRLGSQAVSNSPAMGLIDADSFWIEAYFRETMVEGMNAGDEAVITLMSYPDKPFVGRVESLGWGIAKSDGSTGADLLPNVSPTFEWIRLAQRIPVKILVDELPEGVVLRVGTTASVMVRIDGKGGKLVAAPTIFQ